MTEQVIGIPGPAEVLRRVRGATPRQEAVLAALRDAGWEVVVVPYPGMITFGHPDNRTAIPTPDYITKPSHGRSPYPFPTYTTLHQVTLHYQVTGRTVPSSSGPARELQEVKLLDIFVREAHAPWVGASDSERGFAKTIAFIREQHPGTEHRPPAEIEERP